MNYNKKSEEIRIRYYERMQNQIAGNRDEVQLMMERSFSSACMVLEHTEVIPLPEFAVGTGIFGHELQANKFFRSYVDQLSLAKCNPEQFTFGLHAFFEGLTAKIRKNKEFPQIADFLGTVMRAHAEKRSLVGNDMADAFVNLSLQTLEYLRPQKYDMKTCLYGVSTAGEPMGGPYPLPYSDVPGIEVQREIAKGKPPESIKFEDIQKKYATYGIIIRTPSDFSMLEQTQQTHINMVAALLPFINENTWAMAPIIPCPAKVTSLANLSFLPIDLDLLKSELRLSRVSLPEEEVTVEFIDPNNTFRWFVLQETQYNGKPYILHRFRIHGGFFYGYYDIHEGFLYSILRESTSPIPFKNFTALFLILYASLAIPDAKLPDLNSIFKRNGQPLLFKLPDLQKR